MNKILLSFFLVLILNAFSQVNDLKKSSDKAKETLKVNRVLNRQMYDFSKHVNVFVGTGGHGHTHPAASAPFGMIQLGPDTRVKGWDGCSGYHYSDSIIYGFSHTHLSGTGVEDLNDLLFVPQVNSLKTNPLHEEENGYHATFNHKNEEASPGRYEVKLDNGIQVSLASSQRAGIHQYIFPKTAKNKYILIDLDHRDELKDVDLIIHDKKNFSGMRLSKAWAQNQFFYFHIEANHEVKKAKIITKNGKHKLALTLKQDCDTFLFKVGISAVSTQGAKNNLFTEIPHWSIEDVMNQTKNEWNKEFVKLHYVSEQEEEMNIFYTSMYHAYLCPTLFSDVDGQFRGNDGKIYQDNQQPQYSIFSLWDTYRTAHPLYTLTQQKRTNHFISSFLKIFDQINSLPVWELNGNETNCMIGYHSVSVITDAHSKGISQFDTKKALNAMISSANEHRLGKKQYQELHYINSIDEPESVSKTLEYAYDDWCIGTFAKSIGDEKTYNDFYKRSYYGLNLWDNKSKFMRPKKNGIWLSPFYPSEVNFNYTEANSYQYSMAIPQHIDILIEIMGGKDSLEHWLDNLFTTKDDLKGRNQADITGLIGQYAHGNEPSHHMAYLYNYTNNPFKTQEKVDQILKTMYQNTPEGLSGNEDCGQMSAWFAMSAIGIYPICPGKPYYTFGRPTQDYANFNLENGKTFTISTTNNSLSNKYIQKIELNGRIYQKLYLHHDTIMNGGNITFFMGDTPNLGLKFFEKSPDEKTDLNNSFIPVPYFTAINESFTDTLSTKIETLLQENIQIFYTTNGANPDTRSKKYNGELLIFNETTTLKAISYNNITHEQSPIISSQFIKLNNSIQLELKTKYDNQYNAGGENALIDGIHGGDDFRSGAWQGYFGLNAEGIIAFKVNKSISSIEIGCLQDVRSWIFMPKKILVYTSNDGLNFVIAKELNIDYKNFNENDKNKFILYDLNFKNIKALKFEIINQGKNPKEHPFAGEKAWLFVDEIKIME